MVWADTRLQIVMDIANLIYGEAINLQTDLERLARFVIDCEAECRFNPWRMLPCAEEAIAKYLPPDAHETSSGRCE